MHCLNDLSTDQFFFLASGISLLAAMVMIATVATQTFNGKLFYSLSFVGVIWTLMAVGLEAASTDAVCQIAWAAVAWPGNALVPMAWCFFVFAYVGNGVRLKRRWTTGVLVTLPAVALFAAATNPWHNLVYSAETAVPAGSDRVAYVHGPGFHVIIGVLYAFVFATLLRLGAAFFRAKRSAWPLLAVLVLVTLTPLVANTAYVGFGLKILGMDPTAFMFTLGVIAFTWLLVTNKTIDMATVGQSILFDTMSEPVILIDRRRNIVRMNTAAKHSQLIQGEGRLADVAVRQTSTSNPSINGEHMSVGERVFEPRVATIENPLDPAGPFLGWSITFVDITERVSANAALQAALQRADDANRMKDEFISVISHEMRTPLASLRGGVTLALSGKLGELSEHARSSLEIALRNGVRLSRLVDNLLLAQKLDVNALTLKKEPVDLGMVLEESIEENRMFAASRRVSLVVGEIDGPSTIMGDAFAVRQIVENLISNAIKFSDKKGVVELTLRVSDGRVGLAVRDTGRGIPYGMEEQVFGRFGQLENGSQGSTQGSGLGLYIARRLAREMDGDVLYESREGVGTTFHVEFRHANSLEIDSERLAG
ncbi:ATP-binding protein [Roseibacterium sp. SDUM158016]|uniref:sensor histidine kinase n=1 Tax=Roseicyclus sediminis TaxID=2980997 RepID=UPI0021D1804D|nr:histidine kinase N-terminal 7TM domain-containing protein [Roseibacterium sp. SDUM158016]MCU4654702.1 ATP-binding protein [Roseibacterium sp. SDUM158016]